MQPANSRFSSASNALFSSTITKEIWSGPYGYSLSRIDRAHARIGRRAPDSLRGLGIEILDCIDHTIAELSIYGPVPHVRCPNSDRCRLVGSNRGYDLNHHLQVVNLTNGRFVPIVVKRSF